MTQHLLAIDQGTTNTRAMIVSISGTPIAQYQLELTPNYPQDGWVEQDPEAIWQTTLQCCQQVLIKAALSAADIATIGISNQRETTVLWERKTGRAIYPAIVWQDRRTATRCAQLKSNSQFDKIVKQKTGLLIDPYFSASKIEWLLDHVPQARLLADRGDLAFGTIDSFLLWKLTKGRQHITDITNASRTLLFNIHTETWDPELLNLWNIPASLLPTVQDNASDFGITDPEWFGKSIPITGMIGDQQAALIGQACFSPGMIKSTYGTGCFLLLNTGSQIITQPHLLTTIAYRLSGQTSYGLEGSIFNAGTVVQWLRDNLRVIAQSSETEALAASVPDTEGVYFIPAFTGLGAPYWDPEARAAIFGLTRNTQRTHLVRAALEAVAYQTRDLLEALCGPDVASPKSLRVDGGMAANSWFLQFLADMLQITVERPRCLETAAWGAAHLAGLGGGVYSSLGEISQHWLFDRQWEPHIDTARCEQLYHGWQRAVQRLL